MSGIDAVLGQFSRRQAQGPVRHMILTRTQQTIRQKQSYDQPVDLSGFGRVGRFDRAVVPRPKSR
jgi:hypothetical protein